MRNRKLVTDVFETDPAAARGGHLSKTNEILGLGKGHGLFWTCQFLTPLQAICVIASCRADSGKGDHVAS